MQCTGKHCFQSKKPCRNASKWKIAPTESYISFPPTPRISRTAVNASVSSIIAIFTVFNNDVTKQELWLQVKKLTMGVSGLFKIKDLFFMQMSLLMKKKTSDANGFVSKEIIFQRFLWGKNYFTRSTGLLQPCGSGWHYFNIPCCKFTVQSEIWLAQMIAAE